MMGLAKAVGGVLVQSMVRGSGRQGGAQGGQVNDKKVLSEALKFAKHKNYKDLDPAVINYAATRVQAGFRGYKTRKEMRINKPTKTWRACLWHSGQEGFGGSRKDRKRRHLRCPCSTQI